MSDLYAFFIRFLPSLMRGLGITILLTAQGLAAGFVLRLLATLARAGDPRLVERTGLVAVVDCGRVPDRRPGADGQSQIHRRKDL